MVEVKKTYYVDVVAESILDEPLDTSGFTIQATDKEIRVLEEVLADMHKADWETYVRAHMPIDLYDSDPVNDHYDASQKVLYAIIYHLGDDVARRHIDEMGILKKREPTDSADIERLS